MSKFNYVILGIPVLAIMLGAIVLDTTQLKNLGTVFIVLGSVGLTFGIVRIGTLWEENQ